MRAVNRGEKREKRPQCLQSKSVTEEFDKRFGLYYISGTKLWLELRKGPRSRQLDLIFDAMNNFLNDWLLIHSNCYSDFVALIDITQNDIEPCTYYLWQGNQWAPAVMKTRNIGARFLSWSHASSCGRDSWGPADYLVFLTYLSWLTHISFMEKSRALWKVKISYTLLKV